MFNHNASNSQIIAETLSLFLHTYTHTHMHTHTHIYIHSCRVADKFTQ